MLALIRVIKRIESVGHAPRSKGIINKILTGKQTPGLPWTETGGPGKDGLLRNRQTFTKNNNNRRE